ncbi:MAG: ribonuclease HI [Eubacteriales bacterium]
MSIRIFTDGACSGNPGPGGYGVIIEENGEELALSQGYKNTTNNRMELLAVIVGLESLELPSKVEVVSDSKYVTDAINKNWLVGWLRNGWKNASKQPVKNQDLWQRFLQAKENHEITFTWVKGHNEHPQNEKCDQLAVQARESSDLLEDL